MSSAIITDRSPVAGLATYDVVLDETTSGADQARQFLVIVIDQGISYLAMGWLPTPRGKSP
jgi:hypothetical protein